MSPEIPPPQQAAESVPGRTVLVVLLGAFTGSVFAVGIAAALLLGFRGTLRDTHHHLHRAVIGTIEQGPIDGPGDGEQKNRQARASLRHYAWVDRDAGVVSIPIDRAFDWMLARAPAGGAVTRCSSVPTADAGASALPSGDASSSRHRPPVVGDPP